MGVDLPGGHDDPVVLAKGAEHAEAAAARARAALNANAEVTTVVASGDSIEDAVTQLDGDPDEVVLVGSSRLAQPRRLYTPYERYADCSKCELQLLRPARAIGTRFGTGAFRYSFFSYRDEGSDLLDVLLLQNDTGLFRPW